MLSFSSPFCPVFRPVSSLKLGLPLTLCFLGQEIDRVEQHKAGFGQRETSLLSIKLLAEMINCNQEERSFVSKEEWIFTGDP